MTISLPLAVLAWLHLLSAAFWVGGMAAFYFAVRTAAAAQLQPPLRLPFMSLALGKFFRGVDVAIALLFITGLTMIYLLGGFGAVHWRVHAMLTLAIIMTLVYIVVRARHYKALRTAIAAKDWPRAGAGLNSIRQLVALNLALGVVVFAVALVGRAF